MSETTGPEDTDWRAGKNAATIQFVADAERFIAFGHLLGERQILLKAIQDIKAGSLVIHRTHSPEEYIRDITALQRSQPRG